MRTGLTADRLAFWVFLFCLLSAVSQISLILTSWEKLPPAIPLFYSRPWGETQLASPFFLGILPAITILSTVVDFGIGLFWLAHNKFLWRILVIYTFLVALMTLYGCVKIIALLT